MKKEDCFELGYIAKPHALQGEVSVVVEADDPSRYTALESMFVETKAGLVPYFVEYIHPQPDRFIVKFEEIDTVEIAETLSHAKVYLPLTELPSLEEGQFFYHEIIGFHVHDIQKGALGEIMNVYSTDMQALIAMSYQGKEVLIPITDDIVKEVKRTEQQVVVSLPEGLLEIYLEE